jgi:hypothetical protein
VGASKQSSKAGLRAFWQPVTAAAFVGAASPVQAQVIPLWSEVVAAPWSAQRVFERTPLPQLDDPDTVERPEPEDTPVKTRQHPGYEPVGIRSGSWMLNPALTAGLLYDSNVFSSNTNRQSDVAAVVEPALRARTLWNRHGLDLRLGLQSTHYKNNPGLDQTNYGLRGSGWLDVARDLMVLTSFQASHLNEGVGSLASPANAVQPTPYDLFAGDVTVRKQLYRWSVAVGTGVESYNFGSTRGTATQSLDSRGYRALTGLNIALTRLITGEFGVGYVQQRFADLAIGTIDGPAWHAIISWRPTRLLDVNFKAEQLVTQTSDTSATGVLANSFQLGVDYELLRNVIVSVAGGIEKDEFHGQPRTDRVNTVDSRIKYLPNRFGTISVFHRYTDRNSNIPTFRYEKHLVGFNATAQF